MKTRSLALLVAVAVLIGPVSARAHHLGAPAAVESARPATTREDGPGELVLTVTSAGTEPTLSVPSDVPTHANEQVPVPLSFVGNGHDIASTAFSVDYDQSCLDFDPTDGDSDGVPDAVALDLPPGFDASVTYDAADTDGELDIFVADLFPPLGSLPDGVLLTITLTATCTPAPSSTITAAMGFSEEPSASFGNTDGQSVRGSTTDGSVEILPASPILSIVDQVPAYAGASVPVPVSLVGNGHSLASTAFSVDYDQSCLDFDPTDGDSDGIPDAVALDLPAGFDASVVHDAADTDGELDVFVADLFPPLGSLPDGVLLTITFTATCTPAPGSSITAAVGLSADPSASFGNTDGQSVQGSTAGGSVRILPAVPVLSIPEEVWAYAGGSVLVPISFAGNSHSIASTVFSVDYDQSCLDFDPRDGDLDGIPDAVVLDLPAGFDASVVHDAADADGELDILVADLFSPLGSLPDGILLTITLTATCTSTPGSSITAAVGFSEEPSASFGNTDGQSVPGSTADGSVKILPPSSANRPPFVPSAPTPSTGATGIPLTQTLRWQGGDPDGDVVTCSVAFGPVYPPPVLATNVIITTYDPGPLSPRTTYYWAIGATDGLSTSIGPVWQFTTTFVSGVTLAPDRSGNVTPGGVVVLTHTLTNTGNALDTFDLSVGPAPPGWSADAYPAVVSLDAGEQTLVQVVVLAPTDAISGTAITLPVTATARDDATDFVTNQVTVLNQPYAPSLTPALQWQSNVPGATACFTHTLVNHSNAAETFASSAMSLLDGWSVVIEPSEIILPPFGQGVLTVTITLPTRVLSDTVGAAVVRSEVMGDPARYDECADLVRVQQVVGVALAPDRYGEAEPGQTLTYTHTLANSGNAQDTFTLGLASVWDATVEPSEITLDAYSSAPITVTVTVPAGAQDGAVQAAVVTATSQADPGFHTAVTDTTTAQAGGHGIFLPIVLRGYQ